MNQSEEAVKASGEGWIGVDLDGTLARHEDGWHGSTIIGAPIVPMVERVKQWLAWDKDVRIVTARLAYSTDMPMDEAYFEVCVARRAIEDWCQLHIGKKLRITNEKDYRMLVLYDDRAVQVERNTGRIIGDGSRV